MWQTQGSLWWSLNMNFYILFWPRSTSCRCYFPQFSYLSGFFHMFYCKELFECYIWDWLFGTAFTYEIITAFYCSFESSPTGIIIIPEEMDYGACVGHHVPAEVDYELRYVLSMTLHSKLVFILHKVILKKGQSYNFTNWEFENFPLIGKSQTIWDKMRQVA